LGDVLQGRADVSALFLYANIEFFNLKIQFLDEIIEKLDFDIETFDNFIDALNVGKEKFAGASLRRCAGLIKDPRHFSLDSLASAK
jgi:hypothetical protein